MRAETCRYKLYKKLLFVVVLTEIYVIKLFAF